MMEATIRRRLALIFLAGLVLRLILVSLFQLEPVNDLLWNDAVGWNLAIGNGYTASQSEPRIPGIYRTPGYPAFLAVVYFFFGHSHGAAYAAQAVLDAFSSLVLFFILTHYVSASLALLTALLYALYPYPAMFCGVLHQDILLVASILLVVLLLARVVKGEGTRIQWLLVGAATGFAALVKANMVLFAIVPVAMCVLVYRKVVWGRLLMLICGMVVVLSPWVVRNYVVFHSFPPLAAGATGTNLAWLVEELEGGEQQLLRAVTRPPGRDIKGFLDGKELILVEKELSEKAVAKLRKRWPEFLILMVKHIPRLWITKYSRWHGPLIAAMGETLSWSVLLFGLAGMFLLRHQFRVLLPLYLTIIVITLSYTPYTPEARYTLPARPFMLLFVAATLTALVRRIRGSHA